MALLNRMNLAALAGVVFLAGSAAQPGASTLTVNFATAAGADGLLTFIDNPATTNSAHDSFRANIVSPQFGNGTLLVPIDFTNYVTGTGHSNVANSTFGAGTLPAPETR